MSSSKKKEIWIGVDPGGKKSFGVAIQKSDGFCHTCTVDYVDEAINVIKEHVKFMPAGVGVDAPLWWCSGRSGLRRADQWLRDKYELDNVLSVNSLRGSVLAQGMMFVAEIRKVFGNVPVTETHPKAVLKARGRDKWKCYFEKLPTNLSLDAKPDHERDAVISLVAAREGFEGRWKNDLIDDRYPLEQDPSKHWLAPIHYFWPE